MGLVPLKRGLLLCGLTVSLAGLEFIVFQTSLRFWFFFFFFFYKIYLFIGHRISIQMVSSHHVFAGI